MKIYNPTGFTSHLTGSFSGSIKGVITATGNIVPVQNQIYDLGTATQRFRDIYLSSASIYLGASTLTEANLVTTASLQSSLPSGVLSGSTQIATEISGAFTAVSSSIASDIVSNYLRNTSDTLTGDLTVTGRLTAQEFHTEFVSASILYDSGSTKFGNSVDDTHVFTGTGSFDIVGIGTDTPKQKLHVVTETVSGAQTLSNIDRTSGNLIRFTNPNFSTDSSIGLLLKVFPDTDLRQGAGILATGGTNNGKTDLDLFVTTSPDGTGGTSYSAVKITSDGYVGVGTTSPNAKLEVSGNIYTTSNTNFLLFGTNAAINPYIQGGSDNSLYLGANNSPKMFISSSGNVGIGVTNPSYKLDIRNDVAASTDLDTTSLRFYNNSDGGTAIEFSNSVGGNSKISLGVESAGAGTDDTYIGFSTNVNAGSTTERMRINSIGRVGIGTTNPSDKLHVFTSATQGEIRIGGGNGTDNSRIYIQANGNTSYIDSYGDSNYKNLAIQAATLHLNSAANTGDVSIGTDTPINTYSGLTISGTDPSLALKTTSASGWVWTQYVNSSGTNNFSMGVNQTIPYWGVRAGAGMDNPHFVVDSSGNVGVGTTTVNSKFSVTNSNSTAYTSANTLTSGQTMRISNTNTTSGISANLLFEATGAGGGNGLGTISGVSTGTGSMAFTFGTRHNSSNVEERVRITSDGSVGIGTNSPNYKLHLEESIYTGLAMYATYNYSSNRNWAWRLNTFGSGNWGGIGLWQSNAQDASPSDGTVRFGVDVSGNVGIGTTSPSAKLHINHNNTTLALTYGNSVANNPLHTAFYGGWSGIGMDQTTAGIRLAGDAFSGNPIVDMGYYSSGTVSHANWNSLMIVKQNGTVGIGTNAPDSPLEVNGRMSIRGSSVLYFGQTTTSIGSWTTAMNSNGSTHEFHAAQFVFNNWGYGTSEFMRITSGGTIGIGTTSAAFSEKFQVYGSQSANGVAIIRNDSNQADVNHGGLMIQNRASYAVGNDASIGFALEYGGYPHPRASIGAKTSSEYGADLVFNTRYNSGTYSEKMRIKDNGSVGIGTTSPDRKLSVNGSVRVGRATLGWYEAGSNAWDGYTYLHLKTNLDGGGSGNVEYTMSLFRGRYYSYSAEIREGSLGFHNWSGTFYSTAYTGNFFASPYMSSDGKVVLVVNINNGNHLGVTIDWYQAFPYTLRESIVTAISPSNSSSGVY